MTRFRDWWLTHAPWPFWVLSSCKAFSPICLLDDVAHWLFPMTFGFSSDNIDHWPDPEPLICRCHSRSLDRYAKRKFPEDFE